MYLPLAFICFINGECQFFADPVTNLKTCTRVVQELKIKLEAEPGVEKYAAVCQKIRFKET